MMLTQREGSTDMKTLDPATEPARRPPDGLNLRRYAGATDIPLINDIFNR